MTQTNAADRKDVRKAEKAAAKFERERVEGLRHLTSAYTGRLWLWRHLEEANVFSTTFTGDALTSAFNEGQRARGLAILSDLMLHCPDVFLKMMEENNARSSTDAALTDRDARNATGGGNPVSSGDDDTSTDAAPAFFDHNSIGNAEAG